MIFPHWDIPLVLQLFRHRLWVPHISGADFIYRLELLFKMKKCQSCKKTFLETQFHRDRSKANGRRLTCKACDTASCRRYRRTHKRKMRALRKAWYLTHKGVIRNRNRNHREKHLALALIRAAKYRAKRKNLEFNLTAHQKDLSERLNKGICELTGIGLDPVAKKAFNSP